MNIKITLAYDGSHYYGSQVQPDKPTVASAIYEVFKHLNIDSLLHFSGRTDKDVHASKQVISCQVPDYWSDLTKLHDILNKMLPCSIKILLIEEVAQDFHARYSAKKRVYRYIVSNRSLSPFECKYITYHPVQIDLSKLQMAIKQYIGVHDFGYFSKASSEDIKTTTREMFHCYVYQYKGDFIFTFKANGFLRGQIRLMMQFLLNINDNKNTLEQLIQQLNKEYIYNTKPASPNGLYLSKIIY